MTESERQDLAQIKIYVKELVTWKNTLNDLLYGSLKGEFGYFHKSNIIWRILILWPIMLGSVVFGAVMTFLIQHWFAHK